MVIPSSQPANRLILLYRTAITLSMVMRLCTYRNALKSLLSSGASHTLDKENSICHLVRQSSQHCWHNDLPRMYVWGGQGVDGIGHFVPGHSLKGPQKRRRHLTFLGTRLLNREYKSSASFRPFNNYNVISQSRDIQSCN